MHSIALLMLRPYMRRRVHRRGARHTRGIFILWKIQIYARIPRLQSKFIGQ